MRTIWHSLAWKEWHEHKWKLVSITAVLWGTTVLTMPNDERDVFGFAGAMLLACIIPLSVFVGLNAAANERSRGTLRFLQALPVPLWRVALHKLAFGLITLVVPVLLTLLLALAWWWRWLALDSSKAMYLLRNDAPLTNNWFIDIAFMALLGAASLYIWSAAAGGNRKDEVSAGAVALSVMVGYWLILVTLWSVLLMRSTSVETARLRAVAVATAPGSGFTLGVIAKAEPEAMMFGIVAAIIAHGLLATRYVQRFGQTADSEVRSPQAAATNTTAAYWVAPPRRSTITAIAWKQFRESAPIVLAGVAGIVGIVVLITVAGWQAVQHRQTPKEFLEVFSSVSLTLGFIIALVLGIGVCLYDVSPRVNAFWRSRPVQPDAWFWTKFFTGLIVLLLALYLPLVFVAWLAQLHSSADIWQPEALIFPLVHVAVFSAAVAMTCLVRQAVYAAILSIPLMYLGVVLVWAAIWIAALAGWRERPVDAIYEMSKQQVAVGMIISSVICTSVAWLAMRYDWGRKSRY
ncbi:MAG: hypothetical protein WD738_22670 [Pirellulales bacterium]